MLTDDRVPQEPLDFADVGTELIQPHGGAEPAVGPAHHFGLLAEQIDGLRVDPLCHDEVVGQFLCQRLRPRIGWEPQLLVGLAVQLSEGSCSALVA
jgi:hypothetical protein